MFTSKKIPMKKVLTLFMKPIDDVKDTYYVTEHVFSIGVYYLISKEGYLIRVDTNSFDIITAIIIMGRGINATYGRSIEKTCKRVGRRHNISISVKEGVENIRMYAKLC